ncbi:MAG: hypothetical protein ACREBN_10685 [Burkholderiaceae bacterium]
MLSLQATAALACGHCVEDRIAAVYDHAVLTQATGAGRVVAFCAIEGGLADSKALQREIERALTSSRGVDRDSVRVSVASASVSFAFDPTRTNFAALMKEVDRKLAGKQLSLLPLRIDQTSRR